VQNKEKGVAEGTMFIRLAALIVTWYIAIYVNTHKISGTNDSNMIS
jgi:hypothetical protein